MTDCKPLYVIPEWCRMPPGEHADGLGGCWGISHGFVAAQGEDYCRSCEFHKDQPQPEDVSRD